MAAQSNHAIIFGAAGLLGWSVLNELLSSYPAAGTFSKVTAVVNRPISEKDLCVPPPSNDRPALEIVPGVNLLRGTGEELAQQLKDKASGLEGITHAFYFGMVT